MKRLWIATALALGFHGVLLNMDFSGPMAKRRSDNLLKPVELTLLNPMPEPSKIVPVAQPSALAPARQEPDRKFEPLPAPQTKKPKVRKHPDPARLKTPTMEPGPEMHQEQPGPTDTGLRTPDTTSLPQISDAETQPVKGPRESIADVTSQSVSQALIREAVPLYDRNPPPQYPQQARKRGFQGTVFLKVLVGKDGWVADIRLQESSGHSILDNIALETVRGWAFTPGRRGQDPVEMWIRVPMLFELK